MFDTILIANRGEIACRIIRTARRLGMRSVAVYSEADATARHVALADEAHLIGPAAASESYLRGARIIEVAKASGAQAVHPGYGFLSENADFAEACAAAGLSFIGPPAAAIRAMGSKSQAKALMEAAAVPLVPGYHGEEQAEARLLQAAREIGFPVMIKASAGGGGKGMRGVDDEADFSAALAAAKRESQGAFGDDRMLIEKLLIAPRHIEVQVFCDNHGGGVHLFERDCSLQRRHQKVLEEAPAPGLSAARRAEMGAAAVNAAQAIGYSGAGTVEFIADDDGFYFMEMNTRLQVEHPVTEMITDQDLVEWQLRVAAGEALPLTQAQLARNGHAFEVRIYAEDPERDFLPATGRIFHLRFPVETPHLRIDSGVVEGDEISVHYDPMIAKLIVWDRSRAEALRRLESALARTEIAGVVTNLAFLASLAAHPDFARGDVDTGFIPRHAADLLPAKGPVSNEALALASLAEILHRGRDAAAKASRSNDPYSPWNQITGWRLNSGTHSRLAFRDGEREIEVTLGYRKGGFTVGLGDVTILVAGVLGAGCELIADLDGRRLTANVVRRGNERIIMTRGQAHYLSLHDPLEAERDDEVGADRITAPMPGKIVQILVKAGETVNRGMPLVLLEAMKMEHTIEAPLDGSVAAIHFAAGDLVDEGAELLVLEAADGGRQAAAPAETKGPEA